MFEFNTHRYLQRIVRAGVPAAHLLRCILGNPFRPATLPIPLGPTGEPKCPQCGNSSQNAIPADMDTFRRCATCKTVWCPSEAVPWLTRNVCTIAQTIYDERRFDELPVLVDALLEAGIPETVPCHGCNGTCGFQANSTWVPCELCDPAHPETPTTQLGTLPHPILDHLRSPGPHAKGCWVLDTLLGKD